MKLRKLNDSMIVVCLTDQSDYPIWRLDESGKVSVKSMYDSLCNSHESLNNSFIWKAKIPLKIKIFMWMVEGNSITYQRQFDQENGKVIRNVLFVMKMKL